MTRHTVPTKIRILDSAFTELLGKGFVGFTVQGVSDRVKISLGNLTYHYPNREVLIEALIDYWFESWKTEFASEIQKKIDGDDSDIGDFIDWVMDTALKKENVRMFTELWAFSNHEPKVARMLDKLYNQAVTLIIKSLEIGPASKKAAELRSLLYVLAAVSEGTSAVLGNSPKTHPQRKLIKKQVRAILTPVFEKVLKHNKRIR